MHRRLLIKTVGRTRSHQLMSWAESAGYRLCWTNDLDTDRVRAPVLESAEPQCWHDHQPTWPNPGVDWHIVLVRARDLHRQIISKIVAGHTQEYVVYTEREHPQIRIDRSEYAWHAENIVRTESEWLRTAPGPVLQVWREDIHARPAQVAEQIGFQIDTTAPTRFLPNPRRIESLCTNWADTQTWPVPVRTA